MWCMRWKTKRVLRPVVFLTTHLVFMPPCAMEYGLDERRGPRARLLFSSFVLSVVSYFIARTRLTDAYVPGSTPAPHTRIMDPPRARPRGTAL